MTIEYKDSKRIVALSTSGSETIRNTALISNVDGGLAAISGWEQKQGIKLTSSESGKKLNRVTVNLKKTGAPSGNVQAVVIKGSNPQATVSASSNTIVANDLTSSYVATTFTFSSDYTTATDDYVMIIATGGASGNYVQIQQSSGVLKRVYGENGATSWLGGSGTEQGVVMNVFGVGIKPTDVQDNSLLVEKDTARRYWFTAETTATNQNIEWQSSSASSVTISGNTITKTGSDSWNDGIARSVQTISPSRGGGTVIATHSENYAMVGLSKNPYWTSGTTFNVGDYLMYHDGIYQLGTEVDSFTAGSDSTLYKITMDGNGLVKYFVDNGSGYSEVYESTVTAGANDEYYVLGCPWGSGDTVSGNITGTLTPATWTWDAIYIDDDFSSDSNWTSTGSGATVTSGEVKLYHTGSSNAGHILHQTVPSFSSKAYITFDFIVTTRTSALDAPVFCISSGTGIPQTSTTDNSVMFEVNPQDSPGRVSLREKLGSGSLNTIIAQGSLGSYAVTGTRYYVKISIDGTTITVTTYTGSLSGSQVGSASGTISAITGRTIVKMGTWSNSLNRTHDIKLDNLKIYNGVTSI
jgi:hypothetical protein